MTEHARPTSDSALRTEASRVFARRLAAESIANGDATGWFESLYAAADHGTATVPWAGFAPHPRLVSTLDRPDAGRAVVVGCGLGDDAEYVASLGYATTAFDVRREGRPGAIRACRLLSSRSAAVGGEQAYGIVGEHAEDEATLAHAVDANDMRTVIAVGVSRQQIEDALAVCLAFNTTDRLPDAFEFAVLDPKGFDAGAKYLLKRGYR